jgi:hypothetical protein
MITEIDGADLDFADPSDVPPAPPQPAGAPEEAGA